MASEADVDKTVEDVGKTLEMFEQLKRRDEEYKRRKQRFLEETGIDFEKQAAANREIDLQSLIGRLSPQEQEAFRKDKEAFEEEVARDLAQAEEAFHAQRSQTAAKPKRGRRMRDMI